MKIVEQVNLNGEIVEGYDTSLSKKAIFEKLKDYFPNVSMEYDLIVGKYNNINYSILIKNITYLGNPHPTYKKRIQIAGLPEFYSESLNKNYVPLMLGVYSFEDNLLFCDFKIDTYINKKSHNSSAHVYTDDLAAATKSGIFQKEDYFKNTITVFRKDFVSYFLDDKFSYLNKKEESTSMVDYLIFDQNDNYLSDTVANDPGVTYVENKPKDVLEKIFNGFFFSIEKVWNGIDCYKQMIQDNYKNKYQPEWAGFFLEYKFDKYSKKHNLNLISYYAQDKKKGEIDLDLFFPTINSYGDLKTHSSNSKGIQGNDLRTVNEVLNSKKYSNHIYYIVCEHDTYKDKDFDYVVTKFWNHTQNKSNELSYKDRMKNSVELKKYFVLDINKNNRCYLSIFRQGINSNGKLREPKIMIDVDNIDKFEIIAHDL